MLYSSTAWPTGTTGRSPRIQVDKDPDFKNPVEFAGTGPFMMDQWDSTNRVGHYVRNPNYWRQGLPYFDSVKQVFVSDTASAIAAFASKQLSYLLVGDATTLPTIQSARPDAVIEKWDFVGWNYVRLNQSRAPFTDVRARQAMQLALDYKALNDATYGDGNWSYTGPVASNFPGAWTADVVAQKPGWNPATKAQDIATAKQLLEQAGFPNGKGASFAILATSADPAASAVPIRLQDQWQKAFTDIKVTIATPTDGADFASRLGQGNYDAVTYVVYPPPNPVLMALEEYYSKGSRNYSKFSDQQVDDLIMKAFAELDTNARNALVAQLEQRLLDTIFSIPYARPKSVAAFDPRVRGFRGWGGAGGFGAYDPPFSSYQLSFA